jgi:hypothetical protein
VGIYDVDAIAEQWLYDTLTSYTPLLNLVGNNRVYAMPQVYRGVAPQQGSNYPFVVFQNQTEGGMNEMTINGTIVWNNTLYLVKVVGLADDSDTLSQINKTIRDALHRRDGTALDGQVIACIQERTFVFPPDEVNGEFIETRGGLYRIFAQEA